MVQVYSAVCEGCWRHKLQRACLEHAARGLRPRASPAGSQRRPQGWRCRFSRRHAAAAGCTQLRVRPILPAPPLCSRSASRYLRQQSMLREVTVSIHGEGISTLCRAGVLAASSGVLQLQEGASHSVSLMRMPHGSAQHEVQSLATAQPTTCVLIPSPQHILAAGAAPALDEHIKTCCT